MERGWACVIMEPSRITSKDLPRVIPFAIANKAKGCILISEPLPLEYSPICPHSLVSWQIKYALIACKHVLPISKDFPVGVYFPSSTHSTKLSIISSRFTVPLARLSRAAIDMLVSSDQEPAGTGYVPNPLMSITGFSISSSRSQNSTGTPRASPIA